MKSWAWLFRRQNTVNRFTRSREPRRERETNIQNCGMDQPFCYNQLKPGVSCLAYNRMKSYLVRRRSIHSTSRNTRITCSVPKGRLWIKLLWEWARIIGITSSRLCKDGRKLNITIQLIQDAENLVKVQKGLN